MDVIRKINAADSMDALRQTWIEDAKQDQQYLQYVQAQVNKINAKKQTPVTAKTNTTKLRKNYGLPANPRFPTDLRLPHRRSRDR